MTKFVGRRGMLGIATEVTRGTIVTPPAYWFPFAKMSFFDNVDVVKEAQGLGKIADQDSQYVTFQFGSGQVDAEIYDTGLGFILQSLLGAKGVKAGAGPYTYTYTVNQTNQSVTNTLYWSDPDRNYMFPMAVVDSLKITIAPKGMVEYQVTFRSRKARDWAALTPSFTATGAKFLHQHLQTRFATNVAGLAGASETPIRNLELNIMRNVVNDELLGTVEPDDILSQQLGVEGILTLNLTDDTFRSNMLNGTYQSMEVKLVGSANSSLQIQMPRVAFSQWAPDWTLNAIASQKVNFKANYDAANALDIISTCVLTNQYSTGY